MKPHTTEVVDVLKHFGVTEEAGLSDEQVEVQRKEFGFNELEAEAKMPLWKLVLEQFEDLLVQILLGAAVLSFATAFFEEGLSGGVEAFVEPFVILLILILNAIVGVWQESNAENALDALKSLQPKYAKVYRNGRLNAELDARELVPGDIVEVTVGDKIPADVRVIRLQTTTVRCDEASMTGESMTVMKKVAPVEDSGNLAISGKTNMMFSGTCVSGGKARCVVITTGMSTEIGQIQDSVTSEKDDKTPLKIKLDQFGLQLTWVIGIICALVWIMNYKQFSDPIHGGMFKGCIYYLKIAVALGVAAIPEGLPAVITLCLALGTRRMVKKNAIIRKLPSVETLGCTTVICSDKTGTLTLNEMTVVSFVAPDDNFELVEYAVEGTSYNPAGRVDGLGMLDAVRDKGLVDCQKVCTLCNEAILDYDKDDGKFVRIGEPTEAALKVLAEKMGIPGQEKRAVSKAESCSVVSRHAAAQCEKVATLEFSGGKVRKSMSVIVRPEGASRNILYCKGAPESVLRRCTMIRQRDGTDAPMSDACRAQILEKVDELAKRPLRTLALACKEELQELADYDGKITHPAHNSLMVPPDDFHKQIENYMVFLGFVGIKDPARPEVAPAIAKAKTAGIRVIMITGDKKETAESIATEIGIFEAGEDISEKSFTGEEFFSFPKDKQLDLLMKGGGGRTFSRTDPKNKQALVNLLKEMGEVPAMTGDGVNDAPALKAASIGIAMGIAGTEVAKEASDMVLADDNFATIVEAVEEGRAIYSNMKAFIRYLISSNIGEVASIFFTAMLGFPEGLVPVQLLWVNLVTDGPPATALGFNPADPDIMRRPPRRANDQLISGWVFFRYMVIGLYVGFATVGVFGYWYMYFDHPDGHSLITFDELSGWAKCPTWEGFAPTNYGGFDFSENPCQYFTHGKIKASTLSLSVLVTIEMFNALNALSEDGSLLQMPPWANPYLLLAMGASFAMHFVIMYIPFLASIFDIVPLDCSEWWLVFVFSFPVILIDEVLKFFGRLKLSSELQARQQGKKDN